jgi:hypothetical protein
VNVATLKGTGAERSHVAHWAARFLEADAFLNETVDRGKQDEKVKAAEEEWELAMTRLQDRAESLADVATKVAIALDRLRAQDHRGEAVDLLTSTVADLKLMELREARSKGD